jgi:hypothetical protein
MGEQKKEKFGIRHNKAHDTQKTQHMVSLSSWPFASFFPDPLQKTLFACTKEKTFCRPCSRLGNFYFLLNNS